MQCQYIQDYRILLESFHILSMHPFRRVMKTTRLKRPHPLTAAKSKSICGYIFSI